MVQSRIYRKISSICGFFAVISAALIGLWMVAISEGFLCADARYMVAVGRDIILSGALPTSDPLTVHTGLPYICQQWPVCIAVAAIYDGAGERALMVFYVLLDLLSVALLYLVSRARGLRGAAPIALTCAASVYVCIMERSTPRALDVGCIALCWAGAGAYADRRERKLLMVFPLAGFLIANLHGALWPCALMLPLSLLIDSRIGIKDRFEVAVSVAVTVLACLINPYGFSVLALPFKTVGATGGLLSGTPELMSMVPGYPGEAALVIAILVFLMARSYRRFGWKGLFSYRVAMLLGLGVLSLATRRNLLLYLAVAVLSLGETCRPSSAPDEDPFADRKARVAAVAVSVLVFAVCLSMLAGSVFNVTERRVSEQGAIASLSNAGLERGEGVLADYDTGCEAELWGLKPTLDTRVEVFAGVSGGQEILTPAFKAFAGIGTASYVEDLGIRAAVLPKGAYNCAVDSLCSAGWETVFDDGSTMALAAPSLREN